MNDYDKIINKYFNFENCLAKEGADYSLFNGGKRLRFSFALATAKFFNKFDCNAERIASAIEMIHTYSLIHDDLPCMDNDEFRRGKPSCHKKYNPAVAVLAGDGLLNGAYEVLMQGDYSLSYFRAIAYIAKMCGFNGMIKGQSLDITEFEDKIEIFKLKTSRLFCASIVAPAIYCDANDSLIENLSAFATNFGIAFQLADDLDDEESSDVNNMLLRQYMDKCQIDIEKLGNMGLIYKETLNILRDKIKI